MVFDYGIDFPLVNDIISNIAVAKEAGFDEAVSKVQPF
jgi:hypothetical protein